MSFHKKETEKIELVARPAMYLSVWILTELSEAPDPKITNCQYFPCKGGTDMHLAPILKQLLYT